MKGLLDVNVNKSIDYYERCINLATENSVKAHCYYNLGNFYFFEYYKNVNLRKSLEYYKLAAEKGK